MLANEHTHPTTVTTLQQFIDQRLLTSHFQPIVELDHGHIIGYEALTRGPAGTNLESPRALFGEAAHTRSVGKLEELCWTSAIECSARQSPRRANGSRIFINALPTTLLSHDFERTVHALLERQHVDPSQVVSVQRLLAAITDARVDAARNANPLTGLPGNAMIEHELRSRIRGSDRVALLHLDLDDFKAFNDAYGFHRGDIAITMTAGLLREALETNSTQHFLGHIGGDDFLAIVDAASAPGIGERIGAEFKRRVALLYEQEDRRRGGFTHRIAAARRKSFR